VLRTITTRYGPAHYTVPVECSPAQPNHRTWEYFDLAGYLRGSNPVEAAIVLILKTFVFLLAVAAALPAALFHPVLAPIGLAVIGLALKTGARHYGVWRGDCPHCHNELWVAAKRHDTKEFDCRICLNRVLLKSGRFLGV
jgi:hypothetical protein